jgi:hypothetical protein
MTKALTKHDQGKITNESVNCDERPDEAFRYICILDDNPRKRGNSQY